MTYAITRDFTNGGNVEITRSVAAAGTPVYVTATPDPYYLLGELTVKDADDNEIEMTMYEEGFGFFTMPGGPVTVTVTFNKKYSLENGELRLLCGDFNFLESNGFGPDVTDDKGAVLKVTAAEGVRFTGTCSSLFKDFTNCTEIDLSNVNTSVMTITTSMFNGCTNLRKLNMTGWDTQRVEHMDEMFYDCKSLRELDLSGFNISANMREMFAGAGMYKLTLPADMGVTASMRLRRGYYSTESNQQDYNYSGWQLLGNKYVVSGSEKDNGVTYATLPAQSTTATFVWKKMPDDFVLELPDGEDNGAVVEAWDDITTNVQLTGRKLWKDGDWNTICLPFMALTSEIQGAFGTTDEPEIIRLSTDYYALHEENGESTYMCSYAPIRDEENGFIYCTGFDETTGTLSLFFEPSSYEIMPGTPYLIKWDNTSGIIESPTFSNVTIDISSDDVNVSKTVTSQDGKVAFTGTYDNHTFTAADRSVLFLGTNNKLYYPDGTATTTIGACRAYFQLNGITAGNPASGGDVKAFVLNFGGDSADGLKDLNNSKDLNDGAWFTIDGRKLSGKPMQRGIYIHNGRKEALK